MQYDTIVVDRIGHVAIVSLNRPNDQNRIDRKTRAELSMALREVNSAKDVKAIVLTGKGEYFCGGGQIDGFPDGPLMDQRAYSAAYIEMQNALFSLSKPIIAAIQGTTTAGGVSLMEMCDLAIAGDKCVFGLPEIKKGYFPMLALAVLQKAMPKKRLLELAFTGKLVDAATMLQWNLVNLVVPQDKVLETAIQWATEIAEQSAVAMDFGREAYYKMVNMNLASALEYGKSELMNLLWTDDAREVSHAASQGRRPQFTGR